MEDERLRKRWVRSSSEDAGVRVGAAVSSPADTVEALRRVSVFADEPEE